jgi:hypothetical protein
MGIFDFNRVFTTPWNDLGYDVVFQHCCQIPDYRGDNGPGTSDTGWPIRWPEDLIWLDNTVVIMQCFDFLTVNDDGVCVELVEMERYFGDRARQVLVIHWDVDLHKFYQGPLNLVYFPCHSYELMHHINIRREQWESVIELSQRRHHWQCLNGRVSDVRRWVATEMQKYPHGIVSLGDDMPLPLFPYRDYFGVENEDNWLRLLPVYSSCDINIVTETIYHNPLGIITEKTQMAFLAQQIPIVIGYRGIVDHCEQLGFDMFRDIVDTSYDYLPDGERWRAAIELNRELLLSGINRKHKSFVSLKQRLKKNQDWVRWGWNEKILNDYHARVLELDDFLTTQLGLRKD